MKTTRIYLVRHGQVVNHHELRYNGHFDVDITEKGIKQMESLATFLSGRNISALYSSDLTRAAKGAEIIGRALGLVPVRIKALRELHLGRWEGLTREEAIKRFPDERDFSFRKLATDSVKGGESLLDLRERVMPAMDEIIERHRGESVSIVAHGGVNRVVLSWAMGLDLENFFRIEQDYGCLNVIDVFDDGLTVVKLMNGGPNQELRPVILY